MVITSSMPSFFHETATILDAINVAKVVTGIVILFLGGKYGWTQRSTIYAGMHLSYLCWWMLEQALFPPFQDRFGIVVNGAIEWGVILMIVGVIYAFPAFNAFIRPPSPNPSTAVSLATIIMFTLGSLINTMADVQMHTTKMIQKGLVTEGIYRLCQNPNWFGDYMRYGAFALISGRPSSFLLPGLVFLSNYGSTQDPSAKGGMMDRYGKAYADWVEAVPNKFIPNLDNNALMIMGIVAVVWGTSYGIGKITASKTSAVNQKETEAL